MSATHSPKIVTDSLVSYFDQENFKSYPGTPTQNLFSNSTLLNSGSGWAKSGPIVVISSNELTASLSGGNFFYFSGSYVTNKVVSKGISGISGSIPYRLSYYVRKADNGSSDYRVRTYIQWYSGSTPLNVTSAADSFASSNNYWNRGLYNIQTSPSHSTACIVFLRSDDSYNANVYFADPQFEKAQGTSPTMWTSGSRNATKKWKDLATYKNNITLNDSASYDGKGHMVFDSSSVQYYFDKNYATQFVNNFTINFWWRQDGDVTGSYYNIISDLTGVPYKNRIMFNGDNNSIFWEQITATPSSILEDTTIDWNTKGETHYYSLSKSSDNGIKLYRDGNLITSQYTQSEWKEDLLTDSGLPFLYDTDFTSSLVGDGTFDSDVEDWSPGARVLELSHESGSIGGRTNLLKWVASGSAYSNIANTGLRSSNAGETYRIQYDVYVPSSNSFVTAFRIRFVGGTAEYTFYGDDQNITFDEWVHHDYYFTKTYTNNQIQFYTMGANNQIDSGLGDTLWIDNISIKLESSISPNGKLNGLSIYKKVLSATEIKQNYNALKTRYK